MVQKMEIRNGIWKGRRAVFMERETIRVVLLPELGGKIASLVYKKKGFELAAQYTGEKMKLPKQGARFDQYDASGFDDAFPTINEKETTGNEFYYPDHGEIWRTPFAVKQKGEWIQLCAESPRNHYQFQKEIKLSEDGIEIQYQITNTGRKAFPCLYTWHGLVRYEEDMKLIFPEGEKDILNVLAHPKLGEEGQILEWERKDGRKSEAAGSWKKISQENVKEDKQDESEWLDLTGVPQKDERTMQKFYLQKEVKTGKCGYEYPSAGLRWWLEYDAGVLPYLGFWMTAGGFRGDYNGAWEPASGFYDGIDIAQKQEKLPVLMPGETMHFFIKVRAEEMKKAGF